MNIKKLNGKQQGIYQHGYRDAKKGANGFNAASYYGPDSIYYYQGWNDQRKEESEDVTVSE